MGKFQELRVWQEGKELAVFIYYITNKTSFAKDFGLRDQIRKAAVSISSNIAEGDELMSNQQSIRHFYIAKGSSAEVLTQGIIAHEIGYLSHVDFTIIKEKTTKISKMLHRLIQSRIAQKK